MPSSFVDSIPGVIHLLEQMDPRPNAVLDIGPGWGKYGLMVREYFDPQVLDAVEVPEGFRPTQSVIYDQIFNCDVRLLPEDHYQDYDVALIIDVIEHMSRPEGHRLLWAIRRAGCHVVLSTPKLFEHQHDDANLYETHVSHWTWSQLRPHRIVADESTIDSIIYLLGPA